MTQSTAPSSAVGIICYALNEKVWLTSFNPGSDTHTLLCGQRPTLLLPSGYWRMWWWVQCMLGYLAMHNPPGEDTLKVHCRTQCTFWLFYLCWVCRLFVLGYFRVSESGSKCQSHIYIEGILWCFHSKRLTTIHSHTDGGVNHAVQQPARQEQSGWGFLLRGTSTLS
jgi:hypothetical protein